MTLTTIYCGDDKIITATCYTDATKTTPLDLTGITAAKFTVKKNVNDPDSAAFITKTLGAGIAVTAPAMGGIMTITLVPADTLSLELVPLVCALKIKDSAGKIVTVAAESFPLVRPAVLSTT